MEYLFDAWERVKDLPLTPLDTKVELKFLELGQLFKLIWALTDSEADSLIRLEKSVERDWSSIDAFACEVDEGQLLGHRETHTRFQALRNFDDLIATIKNLEEGKVLEIAGFARDDADLHRYLGSVVGDTIQLSSSYPELKQKELSLALKIANAERLILETEEQAERTLELAQEEWAGTNMVLDVKDCEVTAAIDGESDIDLIRHFALMATFEDGPWTFGEIDDGGAAAMAALNQSFMQSLAKIPSGKTPVYQDSQFAAYLEDMLTQGHMTAADVNVLDQQLAELGFQALGNMGALSFYGSVLRGYANDEGDYGVAFASSHFKYHFDFFTQTEAQSVTTSSKVSGPRTNKKAVFSYHPTSELKDMLLAHQHMVKKTGKRRTGTRTLSGLAECIAGFLANHNSALF